MANLTPLGLYDEYRHLPVTLDDNSVVAVDVHQYQLNGVNNANALKAKDKLIGKIKEEAKKSKGSLTVGAVDVATSSKKADIAVCFMGKGSVADLQLTLRLVQRYGLEKPGDLQQYADANLGLDCNGFVGNYTRRRGLALGPSTDIPAFGNKATSRKTIAEVQHHDVIIWKHKSEGGFGHIAIIETALGQGMQTLSPGHADPVPADSTQSGTLMGTITQGLIGPFVQVAASAMNSAIEQLSKGIRVIESAGKIGLRDSIYWMESVAKKKGDKHPTFTVLRPDKFKAGKYAKNEVFIFGLGL